MYIYNLVVTINQRVLRKLSKEWSKGDHKWFTNHTKCLACWALSSLVSAILTVHYVSECISCHKTLVVITGWMYITFILLLWNLTSLCDVNQLWPLINIELKALYNLRDDPTVIIKSADKCSAIVVWDREDYSKKASKQLHGRDFYKKVQNNSSFLINTFMRALEKIRIRGDLSNDTLNYFLVKDSKFARFYLLTKIHQRLHNVLDKAVT